jgi:ribosomal-protein-alanine N-acetyltransferase
MIIRTDRLVLRPFAPADEDTLFAMFRDDGVRRFLLDGHLVDRDWVRGEIEGSMRRFAEGGLGIFLAREPSHPALSPSTEGRVVDRPIGFAGFRPFREPPVLELLYGLYPAFWGRGLASEMSRAMIELAFDRRGLEVIDTAVDAPNVASVRVLRRHGFSEVGQSPGAFGATLHFRLTRADRDRA